MIIIVKQELKPDSPELEQLRQVAARFPDVELSVHDVKGAFQTITEVYLLGPTGDDPRRALRGVRPSSRRWCASRESTASSAATRASWRRVGFEYNGRRLPQDSFHVFAGLCAVDTRENVEAMFARAAGGGLRTTRAGAYKPRTSPYDFQGHGAACLPYVFELAGKYGIRHHRHGGHPRVAHRGDPPGAATRRATPPASCCRSARATPRTSSC